MDIKNVGNDRSLKAAAREAGLTCQTISVPTKDAEGKEQIIHVFAAWERTSTTVVISKYSDALRDCIIQWGIASKCKNVSFVQFAGLRGFKMRTVQE